MNPCRLVIFDCDGVLVDSELIANRILARALSKEGYDCTLFDSLQKFVGHDLRAIKEQVERELGREMSRNFVEILQKDTINAFKKELKPIRGIDSALTAIRLPKCIASSGSREKINLSLKLTGLNRYFKETEIFSATDVAQGKPAPDLFLFAAEKMNAKPSDCVVIEDSRPGVKAGRAAGMSVLAFAAGNHISVKHREDLAREGAIVFSDMASLPKHLQDLSNR
tara:strand:- start:114 stop:785 length:672 start_codon:yes stop_codon:yes gene_type:complete